jgi:capsular exopolysaccharide synthesis family protein
MGRIDEALKRVADDAPAAEVPTEIGEAPAASGSAFVAPWQFDEDEAATGRPSAAPAGGEPTAVLADGDGDGSRPPRLALFRGVDPSLASRLVIGPSASPILAEQFRRLAATLHHAQLVQGTKVVMIASANPGDGKTLTSANLALTLSESYRRETLLIDADLRRPALHGIFRVPNVAGLNDGLKAGEEGRLSALRLTDRLTLLPGGKPEPDPMGGLTSPRMRRILEEAAARYDWVILDTAPLGGLADAGVLGAMVDAAILVVRANRTPHPDVVNAIEALGRDRVLGCVLNDAEPQGELTYHRYIVPASTESQ